MSFFIAAITFATQQWSAWTSSLLTILLFPRILLNPEIVTLWVLHLLTFNQSGSGFSSTVNTDQFSSAVTAFLDHGHLNPAPQPFVLAIESLEQSSHVYEPTEAASPAPAQTTHAVAFASVTDACIIDASVTGAPMIDDEDIEVDEGEQDWLRRRAGNKRLVPVRPVAPPEPKGPLKKSILHPRVQALRGEYQFTKVVQPVVDHSSSSSNIDLVAAPATDVSEPVVTSDAACVNSVAEVSSAVEFATSSTSGVIGTSSVSPVEPLPNVVLPAVEVTPIATLNAPVSSLPVVAPTSVDISPVAQRPAKPTSIIPAPKPFARGSKLPVNSSRHCRKRSSSDLEDCVSPTVNDITPAAHCSAAPTSIFTAHKPLSRGTTLSVTPSRPIQLSPKLVSTVIDKKDELMDIDTWCAVPVSTVVDSAFDSDDSMEIDDVDSTLKPAPSFAELLAATGSNIPNINSKEQEAFHYVAPMDIEMDDEEDVVDLAMDIDIEIEVDMATNWESSYVPIIRPIPRGRIPTPPPGYLAAFGPDIFLPIQEIHSPPVSVASTFPRQPVCAPLVETFAFGQPTTTQPPTSAHSSLSAFGPNSASALTSTYTPPSPSYSPPSPSPAPKRFGPQVSNAFSTSTKPFIASSTMSSQPSTAFSSLTKPFRASKSSNASLANSAVKEVRRNGPPAFVLKTPIAWSTSTLNDEEDENGRAQRASKFNKKMRR